MASAPAAAASAVVWLRKCLRLHDSAPLAAAITAAQAAGGTVIPVFCLDPHFVASGTVGPVRWRFLVQPGGTPWGAIIWLPIMLRGT